MMTSILAFDLWFENLMLSARTPFGVYIFNVITFFGGTIAIIGIAVLAGVWLARSRRYWPYLAGLATTLAGAAVSGYALKALSARARPDGLIPAITETGFSFPSMHATASIALYGFIAFIFCRLYPEHKRVIAALTTIGIIAIGFSRLYLGMHYPSDILAGYVVGGLWLLIGIAITRRLHYAS